MPGEPKIELNSLQNAYWCDLGLGNALGDLSGDAWTGLGDPLGGLGNAWKGLGDARGGLRDASGEHFGGYGRRLGDLLGNLLALLLVFGLNALLL